MSWKSMLFTDKPLVIPCLVPDEHGYEVTRAVDYETYQKGDFKTDAARFYPGNAVPGHRVDEWDTEFDDCFSGPTTKKPAYEYMFSFGAYDHEISTRYSTYFEILRRNAIQKEFLVFQIEEKGTEIYMMPCLYNHVLSDEDFDNAVDFHLSDYCFEYG